MYDIVGVGHNCIDRLCIVEDYPKEDSSTHISKIEIQGGGAVATAMVCASRLGKSTTIIGPIGKDAVSTEIIELLKSDGVDCSNLNTIDSIYGLQSFVMINPNNGSRTKFPQRDTLPNIEWNSRNIEVIKNSRILHLDGTNYDNAITAAQIAHKNGVIVSLDGCSMKDDNDKNIKLARMADILIMNAKYPLRVTGLSDYDDALMEIANWGPKIVICTLGEKGCKAVINNKVENFPAFKIKAIDTTGAGDVFHGAFLSAYIDEFNLKECIRFASATAALKCTRIGGRNGIPTKMDVIDFINSNS